MIQKPLLWAEVGKSACVLVGICGLRLSPPARYDPLFPPTFGLSLWVSGPRPINLSVFDRSCTNRSRPIIEHFLFLIKATVTIATRILSCG